ncbi:hypothetical protein DMV_gp6 [Dracaena mottle virus]|uniref:Uncharacterized protein n=1 Tax=Dracaena mottle virus TaxID=380669 RepID=Q1KLD0_9VIRU|nr:hypothetical protein DMV_gp6 [Dracaena mottle virus]ABE77347.1 hypothetical protein [Dracaena mottle virus]ABR01173.1 hypothetical protein [Lucky bamboo bacilliform virus]
MSGFEGNPGDVNHPSRRLEPLPDADMQNIRLYGVFTELAYPRRRPLVPGAVQEGTSINTLQRYGRALNLIETNQRRALRTQLRVAVELSELKMEACDRVRTRDNAWGDTYPHLRHQHEQLLRLTRQLEELIHDMDSVLL